MVSRNVLRNPRLPHIFGIEAEWLAAAYLRAKGYRILAIRFRAAGGEIDLVARRWHTLVFVEVKARSTMEAARISISADKKRRVGQAARAFLARLPVLPETIRFDAVFLSPNRWPIHEHAIGELDLN